MGDPAVKERIASASGWRVQRQLGRGQYGTAYLVEWGDKPNEDPGKSGGRPGDQAVAKVVGLEFLPEKEHRLAFQEVELMRKLQHPHIVALQDHFMTESNLELVIVMEFCDCGDLRGEVRRRASAKPPSLIPEAQIMTWFVQLTLALNYMHHRHILHRDLKSSNIFLIATAEEGRDVRIGDFGIARVLEGTVDVAATVVGTPYYMSPEVCKSEPYGFKSDIWALGCVLYEMCMLKHAFESASLLGLVYKIVSEAYDPIPEQYTADLRSLIDRVLDKSHYTRPSGNDLIADAYVRRFDKTSPAAHVSPAPAPAGPPARAAAPLKPQPVVQQQPPPRATLAQMKASMPQRAARPSGGMRAVEPSPVPPSTDAGHGFDRASIDDQPVRRQWCASPFVAAGAQSLEEDELRAKLLLSRIRRALAVRRQNWLQVFASFDTKGNGHLGELEFERAIKSMALGLSDQEIREVRIYLQGAGTSLSVDQFGSALYQSSPQVAQTEDWGRSVLLDLAREARKTAGGISPGAVVRIQGLRSVAGMRMNGSEGVVDRWDSETCRWVVRLADGECKSIRNENLAMLQPASGGRPAETGSPDTAALYNILCEDGDTAVVEPAFLQVVKRFLPKMDETQLRRLLLLQPKNPEGRVDVPELLSQLVAPLLGDHTLRRACGGAGGGLLPSQPVAGGAPAARIPGPDFRPTTAGPPLQARWATSPRRAPTGGGLSPTPMPPNVVPSPRAAAARQEAGGSAPSGGGPGRAHAEMALLRLAQRLLGPSSGPGVAALCLFASRPDELHVVEMSEAVSVVPLGIARAEVEAVFEHAREVAGLPRGAADGAPLPLERLTFALETALSVGVPAEAAALERIDMTRLSTALQRLAPPGKGGRASPQQFRVTVMQAEPFLTRDQLEWLMMLTDQDGEGRLVPWTLLARLGSAAAPTGGAFLLPLAALAPRTQVAPHAPRNLVVTAALARVRDRLSMAGPMVDLERLLCLFDVAAVGDEEASVGREALVALLSQLRLGISVSEAHEVVDYVAGGRSGVSEGAVPLRGLYLAVQRAGEAEAESLVRQLRDLVVQRLWGRGGAFLAAVGGDCGEWLPEAEFRRCLFAALADDLPPTRTSMEDEEDRILLLAEKRAAGDVRWKVFTRSFFGIEDASEWVDGREDAFRSPASPSGAQLRIEPREPTATQQSWRSTKTAQAAFTQRSVVAPLAQVTEPETPRKQGFCPCRRRCVT